MKVKELMTTSVECCPEYSTLNTAAQIMWDNDVGCLLIVDKDNRVIGMLTDRDVCMSAYLQGVPLGGALVTSAMSKEVFSCHADDDVAAAEKLMREKQVHRLPVVDSEGHLVGLISLNDIAREGAREAESRGVRQVTDAEIVQALTSVCAPRQRIIAAEAAL
jgi:CBS domain-containing protein